MNFKIVLEKADLLGDMPGDKNLSLFEATWRADLYKRRNPTATFLVVNQENGDVEYSV